MIVLIQLTSRSPYSSSHRVNGYWEMVNSLKTGVCCLFDVLKKVLSVQIIIKYIALHSKTNIKMGNEI